MCATRVVLVLLFAVIACAVAIPAALPQPDSSAAAPGAPVSVEERQRSALEKRQVGLENGSEQAEDLKASSSYGYGYYGHHGGYYGGPYRPYGYGYGYGYGWGYPYGHGYGYPFYRPFYPYYGYYY